MKPWQTTTPSRLDPLLNPRPVSPPPVTLGMDAIAVLASRSTTGILLTTGRCAGILAAGFAGFEAARSFSTAAAKEALVAGMPTLRSFAWHVNSAQRIYAWIGRSLSCCPGCFDSFLLLTFKQLETAGNERIQIIIVLHSTCWAMFAPGQSGLWIRVDQNPGLGLASCLRCGRNKAIRCVHRFDVNRQQRTPILTWQYRPCSYSFQVNNSQHLFGEMCWKNTLQNFRTFPAFKNIVCFFFPQLRWGEFFPTTNPRSGWTNPYGPTRDHLATHPAVQRWSNLMTPRNLGKKSPPEMVVSLLKIKAESF